MNLDKKDQIRFRSLNKLRIKPGIESGNEFNFKSRGNQRFKCGIKSRVKCKRIDKMNLDKKKQILDRVWDQVAHQTRYQISEQVEYQVMNQVKAAKNKSR